MAGVQIPAWALRSILARRIPANHTALIILVTFLLVAALYVIPTNTYVMTTGNIFPASQAIDSDARVNTGEILLAPVSFYARAYTIPGIHHLDASPIIRVRALLDTNAQVRPLEDLVGNSTPRQYRQQQQATQVHARLVPLAVALEHANVNYSLRTDGVRVTSIFDDAPAKGVLQQDDLITRVNQRDVVFVEHLIATVTQTNESSVSMQVLRDGEQLNLTVPVRDGRVGVRIQNHNLSLVHDAPVQIDLGDLMGSSADILVALEAYSIITQTDITKNRTISGSGSLTLSGDVRAVRGVDLKALIARDAGATIFFVPADDETEVHIEGLEIIRVESFSEALAYLLEQ